MELYLKPKAGANAFREYDPVTKTMVFWKGSIRSHFITAS